MNGRVQAPDVQAPVYHYELSGVVNPMSTRAEQYAVVQQANDGNMRSECQFQDKSQAIFTAAESFKNRDATIDLTRAQNVFRVVVENDGTLNDRFDRIRLCFFTSGSGYENVLRR